MQTRTHEPASVGGERGQQAAVPPTVPMTQSGAPHEEAARRSLEGEPAEPE